MLNQNDKHTDKNAVKVNGISPALFDVHEQKLRLLFFSNKSVELFMQSGIIKFQFVETLNGKRADISIELNEHSQDQFRLSFEIEVHNEKMEYLYVDIPTAMVNETDLKTHMHICLCDQVRKAKLISSYPERYSVVTIQS